SPARRRPRDTRRLGSRPVRDARLDSLATVLCDYSLEIGEGDLVLVDSPADAADFLVAITGAITRRGAHPFVRATLEPAQAALLERGSRAQLEEVSVIDRTELEVFDKYL